MRASNGLNRNVAAVVVTYNRQAMLAECVDALCAQTVRPIMDIIIIDNASTDGTDTMMSELASEGVLFYENTGANLGGAGGFNYGMKLAVERGYEYVWVMDDDCIPLPNALEELICVGEAFDNHFGFLSSKSLWTDFSPCRMNIQRTSFWNEVDLNSVLPTRIAMASFVSFFVKSSVIEEVGLPIKEFFIWSDDLEYSHRISREFPCYYVPDSVVIHKTSSNIGSDLSTDLESRIGRYRLAYRNEMVLYRESGLCARAYQAARLGAHVCRVAISARDNRAARFRAIVGGALDGVFFHPGIERTLRGRQNKKVLELFGEPIAFGGQESYVWSALSHMDLSDLSVDICTPYRCVNEKYRSNIQTLGGKVFEFGLPFEPGKSRRNVAAPLAAVLAESTYDVVHVHSGSATFLAIASKTAKRAGVRKVIVHSHATVMDMNAKRKAIRRYAAIDLNRFADVFCACSEQAGRARFVGRALENLVVVKNGIDVDHFAFDPIARAKARTELGVLGDSFIVGHVGRLSAEKNHAFLLEIFARIVQELPDSLLLLVGDGPLLSDLEERAEKLSMRERVVFVGATTDVAPFLQAMDCFVFPSLYEGFGIAAVEAQAAGLHVVASDAVPELAKLTRNFTTVPLGSPIHEWVDAILDTSIGMRKSHAEDVRQAGFDVNDTAAVIKALYLDEFTASEQCPATLFPWI